MESRPPLKTEPEIETKELSKEEVLALNVHQKRALVSKLVVGDGKQTQYQPVV